MMDRRQFAAALAGLPLTAALARPAAAQPADISTLVEAERAQAGVPALGAAVVGLQGAERLGVAGVRAWPDGPPVQPSDRWHIGSCTKAFTAALAARLIERGLIGWDTTVAGVLGGAGDPAWNDVSLLWLLSHRSGAEGNFDQALWEQMVARGGPLRDQRAWLVMEGLKTPPAAPPNTRTAYANAGYMIAGVMLETVADLDWEALIRREVFAPLGLTEAGFGAPGTPGRLDQPLGHVRGEDGAWRRIDLGPGDDNPAAAGPAGTIHLSLADWSRFIAAHLRADESYLSADSWRRLHTPGEPGWDYAPGWKVEAGDDGQTVLSHLGSNGFFVAQATLWPARGRAVLLTVNLADDAAGPAFGRLLETLK
ncbi:serine hydrolase domain-containing protein [Brevundimonas lenta]|uniref:CubicO group peptidase (Beta-lactamase class C family) n=1 Tax=Brevundimonas lenta TaxID=424796 RepID=A0A7W6JHF6_9CAUL|nr:serine hydrolase domain-containing protein [Brevundimonas lenta]MBB4084223.1 CubicO group peptidase (beta-lactamase class C family) [Brevundimonas lenta]